MNGIKMSDCRFYINEEAGTVVCVIPNTRLMLLDYIKEHYNFNDFNFTIKDNSKLADTLIMPNSFIGKAVCANDDAWDEEVGKLIAYSRAKDKCYKSFFKRANTYVQIIDQRLGNIIENFNIMGVKLENKGVELQEKIEEFLNDVDDDDDDDEE